MILALAACASAPSASNPGGSAPATSAAPASAATAGSAASPNPSTAADPVEIAVSFDNITLAGIDPALSPSTGIVHMSMIYNALMKIDEKTLKPVPDLADSSKVSDDGLTYTFTLKKGVNFHNNFGELTSADVVFSLLRARDDPKSQALNTVNFAIIKDVTAPDPNTVVITLKQAFPDFIYYMTDEFSGALIYSKKAFDTLGADGIQKTDGGTGPFVFDAPNWVPQQKSHFISFKDYFGGAPKVSVTLEEIKDGSTAVLAMQKGEIQFLLSSQLEIVNQAKANGAVVDYMKAPIYYGFFFNGANYAPFKDDNVRKALFTGIDREGNRNMVFGDTMARAMTGVMPDTLPGYTEAGLSTISYDPTKAAQMLKDAGYENKINFEAIIQNNVRNERIFTLLQANFKKIGVTMNIKEVSTTEYYAAEQKRQVACSYISVTGMPDMFMIMNGNFHSGQLYNYTDYAGIDSILDKAANLTEGSQARNDLYAQAQVQLSKDMPVFGLHAVNIIMVHSPKLQGLYSKGANGGDVRFDKCYVQ